MTFTLPTRRPELRYETPKYYVGARVPERPARRSAEAAGEWIDDQGIFSQITVPGP